MSSPADGASLDEPMAPTEDDWEFMLSWLEILEGRVTTTTNGMFTYDSDPVRISKNQIQNCWLRVSLDREIELQGHPDGEQSGLRELREALILAHLLAIANYELWYKWMVTFARYNPPAWFIPETSSIPLRYEFAFRDDHDVAFMGWDNSLAFLVGDTGYSNEFLDDLELVKELLPRYGIAWENLPSIPTRLSTKLSKGEPVTKLERLTTAVKEIEIVQQRSTTGENELGHGAVFQVAQLDLDLSDIVMTAQLFDALLALLRIGVPVETLWMPQMPESSEEQDRVASMERVGEFMRMLFGLMPSQRETMCTHVCHIAVSFPFARTRWFAPFCSAMATTQSVRLLHLYRNVTEALDASGFGSALPMRRHIWSWLAYALFSSASHTSVRALSLIGEHLLPGDALAVQEIIESSDPLNTLYSLVHGDQGSDQETLARRETKELILNGTISVRDAIHAHTFTSLRRISVTGEVMRIDDESRGIVRAHVLVPGLGFCHITYEIRPAKRARIDVNSVASWPVVPSHNNNASRFKTFKIRMDKAHETSVDALVHMLQIIGPRLRGVGLDVRGINDQILGQIFAACPRLKSLALRGVKLSSMDVFTRAYNELRLPLSSIILTAISVRELYLQRFLRSLLACNLTEAALTRLNFGGRWAHELSSATFAILGNVLDHNKTLSHVTYHVSSDQARTMGDMLTKYHGHVVPGVSYTQRKCLLAFLGSVRRRADENPIFELTATMKQCILEHAAPLPLHRVVTQGWTTIGEPDAFSV